MAETANSAGVKIVAGDTKVVERGSADKIFINTSGVGWIREDVHLSSRKVRPGDRIVVSGSIGDHGMAVLSKREGLEFSTSLESDCAPLNGLVHTLLDRHHGIRVMRDPTRGGLATTLIELAQESNLGFEIHETSAPVHEGVRAACELLGLDPFYVANEGKLIAIVSAEEADSVLATLQGHPLGKEAKPHRTCCRIPSEESCFADDLRGDKGDGDAGRQSSCRGSVENKWELVIDPFDAAKPRL